MRDPMFSYAEQTGHYFARPDAGPRLEPIASAADWRGRQIVDDPSWRFALTDAHRSEIETALDHAASTGREIGALRAEDFPLPTLSAEIARWTGVVHRGRGFQVVSGVPVDSWPQERAETFFWCVGLHMGVPGAQNVQGDLLGHVVDTGADADDPFVRLYRTSADIAYHCDAADVVGLLCLRPALEGGASRIVSSVAVFNELVASRPDLAARLFEPVLLDVRDANRSGVTHIPIPPCRYSEGALRTFYHSDYFRSVERHEGLEIGDLERELMEVYEQIACSPELYLDMDLAAGDIQWLSNHTVLHARTAYEDDPQSDHKRHLLRLWLSIA